MGTKSEAVLKSAVASIVGERDYECVGIDIRSASAGKRVRIYIDRPGGIQHADCERISRTVGDYFDACEAEGCPWFSGKFFVEVSSPGVERPLFTCEHYRRFIGRDVLIVAKDGRKLQGRIETCDEEGNVKLLGAQDDELLIVFEEIKRANLVFAMEKGEKKGSSKKSGRGKRS